MDNKEKIPTRDLEFDEDLSFELSKSIRWTISIPSLFMVLCILAIYAYLILWNPEYIEPDKYGLPVLFISLILILIIVNLPWNKLGFRIKKIGMIELENVVKGQAQNNSKELADLQKQIDQLKLKIFPDIENPFDPQTGRNRPDNRLMRNLHSSLFRLVFL